MNDFSRYHEFKCQRKCLHPVRDFDEVFTLLEITCHIGFSIIIQAIITLVNF